MIYIDLTAKEPNTDEWKEWRKKCDTEQTLIIKKTQEWITKWTNIQQPTKEQIKEKKKEKPKADDKIYNNSTMNSPRSKLRGIKKALVVWFLLYHFAL